MKRYRHKRTGVVIEVESEIRAKDWQEVVPANVSIKSEPPVKMPDADSGEKETAEAGPAVGSSPAGQKKTTDRTPAKKTAAKKPAAKTAAKKSAAKTASNPSKKSEAPAAKRPVARVNR